MAQKHIGKFYDIGKIESAVGILQFENAAKQATTKLMSNCALIMTSGIFCVINKHIYIHNA